MSYDLSDLKDAIKDALAESRGVDANVHAADHRFIADEIKERKRRRQRFEKIREHVMGWMVISILTGVVSFIGYFGFLIYENIKRGLH